MIPEQDVRALVRASLAETASGDGGAVVPDDTAAIALDSLSLTWLLHRLETAYGVDVQPTDEELAEFRSVDAITAWLLGALHRQSVSLSGSGHGG